MGGNRDDNCCMIETVVGATTMRTGFFVSAAICGSRSRESHSAVDAGGVLLMRDFAVKRSMASLHLNTHAVSWKPHVTAAVSTSRILACFSVRVDIPTVTLSHAPDTA